MAYFTPLVDYKTKTGPTGQKPSVSGKGVASYFPKLGETIASPADKPGITQPSASIQTATEQSGVPNTYTAPGLQGFGNLSKTIGGGQYTVGKNKNEPLKLERGFETFAERQTIRGPYAGETVGIDHKIPFSLGGTNDLTNIQLLPKDQFDKKTIYDNLASQLYKNKHISLAVARNLDLNWNNNPGNVLGESVIKNALNDPSIPEVVTISGGGGKQEYRIKDEMRRMLKEDLNARVTSKGFKEELKRAPEFIGNLFNKGMSLLAKVADLPLELTGQKKIIANPLDPKKNPLLNLPAGVIGGITGDYVNPERTEFADKNADLVSKFSYGVGKGIGLGLNISALGKVLGLGASEKLASSVANSPLKNVPGLTTLGRAVDFLFGKAAPVTRLVADTSVAKAISASPIVATTLQSAGLFGLQGQFTRQESGKFFDLEHRAHRFIHDVVNGGINGLTGGVTQAIFPTVQPGWTNFKGINVGNVGSGALLNAGTGFLTSKIEGASNSDALMNAGIFGTLHITGIFDNAAQIKFQKAAQERAQGVFRNLGVDQKINSIQTADAALEQATKNLAAAVNDGEMTHAEAAPKMIQAVYANRALRMPYLPLKEQIRMQMSDMASAYLLSRSESSVKQQAADSAIAREAKENKAVIDFVETSREQELRNPLPLEPEQVQPEIQAPNEQIRPDIEGVFQPTGYGDGISPIRSQNQRTVISYLESSPETHIDFILQREPTNIHDPNAIIVKAVIDRSAPIELGYVPTADSISNRQNAKWADSPEYQYNVGTNNLSLAQKMDEIGLSMVHARITPFGYGRTAGGKGYGVVSGEPYFQLSVPASEWRRAAQVLDETMAKQSQQTSTLLEYKNRSEYFEELPKTQPLRMGEAFFTEIEKFVSNKDPKGLINFLNSYGKVVPDTAVATITANIDKLRYQAIIDLFARADAAKALNESGNTTKDILRETLSSLAYSHGNNALARFFSMPIEKGQQAVPVSADAPKTVPVEVENTPLPPQVAEEVLQDAVNVPSNKNAFLNLAVETGVRDVEPNDYMAFQDSGKLAGISKRVINKVNELLSSGVSRSDPKIQSLFKFYEDLSPDKMQVAAKSAPTFEKFLDRYITKATALGFEPFDGLSGSAIAPDQYYALYNNDQLQTFKHRYLSLKQAPGRSFKMNIGQDKNGIKISTIPVREHDPVSWFRNKVDSSPDAQRSYETKVGGRTNMQVVGLQQMKPGLLKQAMVDSGVSKAEAGKWPVQLDYVASEMRKRNIFLISSQNGDVSNSQGVYIPPELQKEYLQRYYNNPEKYPISQDLLDNLQKFTGKSKIDEDGRIMQVFYKDVLGLNNATADMINKRINLLDHSAIQWDVPGEMELLVLPATEVTGIFDKVFPAEISSNPEVKQMLVDKFLEDGARFMFPETIRDIRFYLGEVGDSNNIKGTIAAEQDGGVITEKGNTVALNQPTRRYLEDKFGITLRPDQIITFDPNIKTGAEFLQSVPEQPTIKRIPVKKRDMRFIFESPHEVSEQEGTFSYSNLGNFSANDVAVYDGVSVPIKDYLTHIFKPSLDKVMGAIKGVYEDGKDFNTAFKDSFGKTLEDSTWGKMKQMAAEGADVFSLSKQFETNVMTKFRDSVMRNREMDSAYLKLTPDLGFFDPEINDYRYLRPDEVMMSRQLWNKWRQPESVLTIRYPITGKLAMSKLKVLIGENYGIDTLGADNVIDNHFDVMVRKQADHDGDGLTVIKIIPKDRADKLMAEGRPFDGFPEPVADHIEQQREQYKAEHNGKEPNPEMIRIGDQEFSIAGAKYPKLPAADAQGLLYVLKRAAMAKQEIGGISNNKNLARVFVDNKNTPQGQAMFTVDGKYYEPNFNLDADNSVGAMVQAAVDATSKDVFGNLTDVQKNPLAVIFNTTDPKVLRKLSQGIYDTYMAGLRLNKTVYPTLGNRINNRGDERTGMLADVQKFLKTIPDDPTMRHPMQEVLKAMSEIKVPVITEKQQWDSDLAAGDYLKTNLSAPEPTENSGKFVSFFTEQQQNKARLKQLLRSTESDKLKDEYQEQYDALKDSSIVEDYFYDNKDHYTQKDLEAISWFLATDPRANWFWDPNFVNHNNRSGGFVERFFNLMLPTHRIPYYQARQQWATTNGILQAPKANTEPVELPSPPETAVTQTQEPTPLSGQFKGLQDTLQL